MPTTGPRSSSWISFKVIILAVPVDGFAGPLSAPASLAGGPEPLSPPGPAAFLGGAAALGFSDGASSSAAFFAAGLR